MLCGKKRVERFEKKRNPPSVPIARKIDILHWPKRRMHSTDSQKNERSLLRRGFRLGAKPLNSFRRRRMAVKKASAKRSVFIEQNLKRFAKPFFWLAVTEVSEDFDSLCCSGSA
jgi:hypothetical protein